MDDITLTNQPPADELTRLTQAVREALTDTMVERLAVTGANALELIDRLNDESTSTALHALIDRLTELHKVGAIDTLCDTLMMVHALRNALTDNMVERLFTFFEQMINTVGNEAMGELAQNTRVAFKAAVEETAQTAPRGGLFAMLAMLSKPEAQRSLAFLLAFGEKLQRGAAGA
jgi:uncharacterized protein YjgD (DUF1641 family)